MHESSLIENLIKKIENVVGEQKAAEVRAVRVKLGALTNISADHFREHFVIGSKGTIAENADLDIAVSDDIYDPNAQQILLEGLEVSE
ncbi:hydrogenase maturation nickel metallochaperone HypA [bacterium]|nr:hydrogenase maturation nickel metallochaperone HypA [bacterium]MBU1651698.1 hydrogenase maturation nickel metallochaperone HypA [bacterium]MBU1881707.1 hydrogenase maturation nickel metallochaperone HypA [bacterium]